LQVGANAELDELARSDFDFFTEIWETVAGRLGSGAGEWLGLSGFSRDWAVYEDLWVRHEAAHMEY